MKAISFEKTIKPITLNTQAVALVAVLSLFSACAPQSLPWVNNHSTSSPIQKNSFSKFPEDPDFEISWKTGVPRLYLKKTDRIEYLFDLKVVPKGTRFYHWGSTEETEYYDRLGHMPAAEIEQRVNQQNWFHQGGGYYMSSNPIDTQSYGSDLLIAEVDQDILIASSVKLQKLDELFPLGMGIHPCLNSINRALRFAGVHGLQEDRRSKGEDWFNLIHPEALKNLRGASSALLKEDPETALQFIRGEPSDPVRFAHIEDSMIQFLLDGIFRKKDPRLFQENGLKRIIREYRSVVINALRAYSKEIDNPAERSLLATKVTLLNLPFQEIIPRAEWTVGEFFWFGP